MTTLRDALADALGKAETGTLEAPQETTIEADVAPVEAAPEETAEQRTTRH